MIAVQHPFFEQSTDRLVERFGMIFDMPSMGIAVSMPNKQFYDVNERFCDIVGYSRAELDRLTWTDITHPDDLNADVAQFTRVLRGEITHYHLEKRYVRKDGGVVWTEIQVQVFRLPTGEIDFLIAFVEEIGDRILRRQELRQQLEISALANEALVEKNRRLQEYAHITSHNLRSPVGNLNALIHLYRDETDEAERSIIFDQISRVATVLTDTVNALVSTLAIKTEGTTDATDISIADLVERIRASISHDVRRTGATIETDVTLAPTIHFSAVYLESILLNLVTNALRYRHPDRPPSIVISTRTDDTSTILQVADNGLGIDLTRYGGKLFGLRQTFHRHPDARGIGLFLTKSMIEASGGEISVESVVDHGTTFTLKFPNAPSTHVVRH
ncbi:MAG TPA: PAS domain S-box protein [Chlorobiota bacterium]|nr:PAS domain S-box protein [Chlorobiota bacterium]